MDADCESLRLPSCLPLVATVVLSCRLSRACLLLPATRMFQLATRIFGLGMPRQLGSDWREASNQAKERDGDDSLACETSRRLTTTLTPSMIRGGSLRVASRSVGVAVDGAAWISVSLSPP